MAYYNNEEDKDEQPIEGAESVGPQGTAILGESGAAPGGSAQGRSAQSPDKGSNFVGIHDYLKANESQAGKLGDQAAGVIQNSADAARSSTQGLQDRFNQEAKPAVQLNQDLLNKVPQAERLSAEEKQNIKNQYNANYTGPMSLQDYGQDYTDAIKKSQTAKANVENSGTEQGRQQIISQINNQPRNAGMTSFDNVLLQAGGGREKLAQAANANKDVTQDALSAANLSAQQKAADIKSQNDATRTAAQSAVSGAQTRFDQSLQDRIARWQQGLSDSGNSISKDITDLELNPETLDAYGLGDGQSIYDLDLKNYLNPIDPSQVNAKNVASNADYERYLALSELAGTEPTLLNPNDKRQFNSETGEMTGLAGTAPKVSVDINKFLADRAAKEQAYNDAWNKQGGLDLSKLPDNQTGTWIKNQLSKLSPAQVGPWLEKYRKDTAGDNQGVAKWFADAVQEQLDNLQNSYRANQTVKRAQ